MSAAISGAREGRASWSRRLVARALARDLRVFVVPGPEVARARGLDLEAAGLRPVDTLRHASVLMLIGELPAELKNAAAVSYAQMLRPRAFLAIGTDDASPLPKPDASADMEQEALQRAVAGLSRSFAERAFSPEAPQFDVDEIRTRTEYQMVSHGVVTGALFLLVGMLQERAHTREMGDFGGLLRVVPLLGWFFILAAFASLGLPGLAHFPAEFQIFLGTLGVYPVAAVVVLGIAVTAGLYLRAIQVAFLGETPTDRLGMKDLGRRELLAVVPLLTLTVLIGVAPFLVLDVIHATTQALLP